jgi:hypothetical protein
MRAAPNDPDSEGRMSNDDCYRMKADSTVDPTLVAGTIVYKLKRYDYGAAHHDGLLLGTPCQAVTLDPSGDYPFVVVPVRDLEAVSHD